MPTHQEYPLVMVHPAMKAPEITPIITPDPTRPGAFLTNYRSTAGQLAPVTVYNADQEAQYEAKGYKRGGASDANAFQASFAAPYRPGAELSEWPKMIDGKLVQDPSIARGPVEYPKWVGPDDKRVLVQNEAEELAWMERATASDAPDPSPAPSAQTPQPALHPHVQRRRAGAQA